MIGRMTSGRALVGGVLVLGLMASCSARTADTAEEAVGSGDLTRSTSGLPEDEGSKAEPDEPDEPKLEPELPTLDEEHFDAFDLLVNRPLAHRVERAGDEPIAVVDAASADFVRYVHGNHHNGFMLDVELEGEGGAATKGRNASVWMPALRPEGDHLLQIQVYNPARHHNALSVTLNGSSLEPVELEQGWQVIDIDVPADANLRADNELALSFSNLGRINGSLSGGAFGWFRLGQASELLAENDEAAAEGSGGEKEGARDDEGAEDESAGAPAEDQGGEEQGEAEETPGADARPSNSPMAQGELELEPGEGLAWFVWLPDEVKLDVDMRAEEGCGLSSELFVEAGEGRVSSATQVTRELVEGRGEVQSTAIDLSEWAGQIARLELAPSDGCEGSLTLERAQLVVPGEKPEVPDDVEPPKRVIVWMIDTLRSDYVPVHFDTDVATPNLEKLAGEGASFSVSYVQGNESRTSHASFFTGMYPSRHGLVGKGSLKPHQHLLQEAVREHGYKTGIHVSNGYVSRPGGFNQGWDYYVNNLRDGWAIDGMSMAEQGVEWVTKNAEEPFFFYIGTIDPHVTYRAHDHIIDDYDDPSYAGSYKNYLSGEALGRIASGSLKVSDRDKQRIINLYKNEITFNDEAFGKLREGLEEEGLWEDTMVVITSDHGEEFWEHGGVGHGHGVHQELVHVPIMFYYPPLIPEGTTVEAGADVVDIYPTILDALGAEQHDDVQGKSLLPLIHNAHGGYPEPAIATHYLRQYGVQMQQWKLHLKHGRFALYDRSEDPGEHEDVADEHPLASRWMQDATGWFRAHRSDWEKQSWGVPSNVSPKFLEKIGADDS